MVLDDGLAIEERPLGIVYKEYWDLARQHPAKTFSGRVITDIVTSVVGAIECMWNDKESYQEAVALIKEGLSYMTHYLNMISVPSGFRDDEKNRDPYYMPVSPEAHIRDSYKMLNREEFPTTKS